MSGPEPDGTVEVRAHELCGVETCDEGPPGLRGNLHQKLDEIGRAGRVQRRDRLIREHRPRRLHKDPCDGHALLLSTREVRGPFLRLVLDANTGKRFETLVPFSGGH